MVDGLFGYNCLKTMIDYSVEWIRSRELIKVKGLLQDARQPPPLRSLTLPNLFAESIWTKRCPRRQKSTCS